MLKISNFNEKQPICVGGLYETKNGYTAYIQSANRFGVLLGKIQTHAGMDDHKWNSNGSNGSNGSSAMNDSSRFDLVMVKHD